MSNRRGAPSPAPEPVAFDSSASDARSGRATMLELMPTQPLALPQPHLSAERVGETRALFQDFLDHLDRLGLGEPATHVSLAFERFLAMYPDYR